jgi:quinoprotein glucose dehydrogenase
MPDHRTPVAGDAASHTGAGRGTIALSVMALLLTVAIAGALTKLRQSGGSATGAQTSADIDWPSHGGGADHRQYSALAQITRDNVAQLREAWTYRTGDARPGRTQIQCNPIVIRGTLYATSPQLKVFALDAATGQQRWIFDPFAADAQGASTSGVNRGVVYWEDRGGADGRILFTVGARLFALDAATGRPIESFGAQGVVDLHEGFGRDVSRLLVRATTPGTIYRDLLILGSSLGEGPGPAAPGDIRAFDVRTGRIRWTFHTIPHPGEPGYETWPPDAWTRVGGANSWSGLSVDATRGLVFAPTGSAAFDFWGGNRHGANLYANSLIALDAATGTHVWHFQFVHHDIWDRDLPQAPVLVTVRRDGRDVDAVAQATKSGYVFVFDRQSGAPLFPIDERAAPASDVRGEQAWATQPVPVKPAPFARQTLTEADVTTISPEAAASARERLRGARTGRLFIPPSEQGTIVYPGFDGGAEWGGSAFDPRSGRLFVNANEMAWILRLVNLQTRHGQPGAAGRRTYQVYCGTCHGEDRGGDPQHTYPSLNDIESRLSRANVHDIIQKGRGVMPPFAMLKDAEREALVAYLFNDVRPPRAAAGADDPPSDILFTHTGYNRFLDREGYPAIRPPWGTLSAIDLNGGDIAWQIPLGEYEALTKRGIPPTGTENYGGPIVTATGLLFIGASKDEKFRAFDVRDGSLLWQTTLPAAGHATPATYAVNGKQFVVIAAGGGKGTKSGDAYVAFALP